MMAVRRKLRPVDDKKQPARRAGHGANPEIESVGDDELRIAQESVELFDRMLGDLVAMRRKGATNRGDARGPGEERGEDELGERAPLSLMDLLEDEEDELLDRLEARVPSAKAAPTTKRRPGARKR